MAFIIGNIIFIATKGEALTVWLSLLKLKVILEASY
jgi:hypothetical protein